MINSNSQTPKDTEKAKTTFKFQIYNSMRIIIRYSLNLYKTQANKVNYFWDYLLGQKKIIFSFGINYELRIIAAEFP